MGRPSEALLDYYAAPGPMTDLARHADRLTGVPREIGALAALVQGLVMHPAHAWRYGLELSPERQAEAQRRSASDMLDRVLELDDRPLTEPRPPELRVVGNCRHFSTLTCALLRNRGAPARARCGFGTYFEIGKNVDHWICEVWDGDEDRWVAADAQIDDVQRKGMGIDFDTLDIDAERFQVAGQVWQRCRAGEIDPELCGIFDMWGLWFVRDNLVRDLASLNKVELLPWDGWGLMLEKGDEVVPENDALLDRVAELTQLRGDPGRDLRPFYAEADGLRVPDKIRSYTPKGPIEVRVLAG